MKIVEGAVTLLPERGYWLSVSLRSQEIDGLDFEFD
jgi:hypothetical protein